MLGVVAVVGRPNVGKSTLFNCLTNSRDALVVDQPGTTRDRRYGRVTNNLDHFVLVDTGGVGLEENVLDNKMTGQTHVALAEADVLLLMVDAHAGLLDIEKDIAQELRALNKPVLLVVNKIDGVDTTVAVSDFFALGLQEPIAIAAKQKRGINKLLDALLDLLKSNQKELITASVSDNLIEENNEIKITIVGQPNVGKSTLVNRLLGEDRMVVLDHPGTTRDSISVSFSHHDQLYQLVDTAGIRRKAKIVNTVEKFSVIQALRSIEVSQVVLFLLDARRGLVDQDLNLLKFIKDSGKALVIVINKWDGLTQEAKKDIKQSLKERLSFVQYAENHFISALHGSGVGNLFQAVQVAYRSAMTRVPTARLSQWLHEIVTAHAPPMVQGRRIKLRMAHMGGMNPPTIVIHGNQTDALPISYRRYLTNAFLKRLHLIGTPVRIQLKTGENPYAGKHNILTPRQLKKRQRLRAYSKRK